MRFRYGVLTVTLAIATAVPLAGTAMADGSRGPGLLTATDYTTGTADMVALNPVSGSVTAVFAQGATDGVLSPDGSQVAYIHPESTCIPQPEGGCDYAQDLVVAGADGSNPHVLVAGIQPETNNAPYVAHPHWSPDGQRIVFDSPRGLEWVNTDGTGEQTLTVGMRGTFSPDGRSLAFLKTTEYQAPDGTWQYGTDVYVMDTTSLEVRQITTSHDVWATPADWSPDGTRLAYTTQYGVHSVDVADGAVTDLNSGWTGPLSSLQNPVYSPDGTKIAFEGHDDLTGGNATYVMNAADGSGLRQLTDRPVLLTDWHAE
ncbi:hypothetical protein ACH47Z_40760 [Streptomyces sp. NPDC020192]|uniref:hypothetical protein n=1 Tax=Streptomyces sp. NPDC020192 TaxID=3365066 RepID=UPI0037A50A07